MATAVSPVPRVTVAPRGGFPWRQTPKYVSVRGLNPRAVLITRSKSL